MCYPLKKNLTFNLSFTILSKQSYHHHSRVSTMWLEIIETGSPPEFTAKAKQSKSTLKNFGNTYSQNMMDTDKVEYFHSAPHIMLMFV